MRKIANHVTMLAPEFLRPVFAAPLGVELRYGKPCLVLQFVQGDLVSGVRLMQFQVTLERVLLRSGLPTWSITTRNPKASEDIVDYSGELIALDFEAVLPPLFVNHEERQLMRQRGEFFPIDAVDWPRLESALAEAKSLGYEDYSDFAACVEKLKNLGRHT